MARVAAKTLTYCQVLMPFALPSVRSSPGQRLSSLSIEATIDLPKPALYAVRKSLPLTDGAFHAIYRQGVELASTTAEIFGLLGVHDVKAVPARKGQKALPAYRYVHYNLELRRTSRPRDASDKDRAAWEKAWSMLSPVVATHSASTTLRLTVPKTTHLAIALPIVLAGETPGLSEIWGVRLVQPDPDDAKAELYSVILDQYRGGVSITAMSVVEVSMNEQILRTAFDRASEIAQLATFEVN